ncbi:hypothetical protein ACYBSK_17100 [Streptomyces sp. BYX5S]
MLAGRYPGRARLRLGRRCTVEITLAKDGSSMWTSVVVRRDDGSYFLDGSGASPTWDDIDRSLAEDACVRKGPAVTGSPEDGAEFDVLCFESPLRGRDTRPGERQGTVALSVPAAEVADLRRALADLAAAEEGHPSLQALASLAARVDGAGEVTVPVPVDELRSLRWVLSSPVYRRNLSAASVRALDALCGHIDRARPVSGPAPQVRALLHEALSRALARPGAEGLAARDELLDMVSGFAAAYRTATAADDEEQRLLQAERAAPAP